jgi:hypothetical protein
MDNYYYDDDDDDDDDFFSGSISTILEPNGNAGALYLGDDTSTESENLEKLKIKAIISAVPY